MGPLCLTAFLDECGKIKLSYDPIHLGTTALLGGIGGVDYLRNRPITNNMNEGEVEAIQAGEEAITPQAKLEALKKRKGEVSKGERAGALLGMAGLAGGSYGVTNLLNKSIKSTEAKNKARTSPELMETLRNKIVPDTKSAISINPEATYRQAFSVPKGGSSWTSAGKAKEMYQLLNMGASIEEANDAMARGLTVLPGKAGPHVSAHELGHIAFNDKPYSKLVRKASTPLAFAGGLGSLAIAGTADPDSTLAKAAPLAAAAGAASPIVQEALASLRGLKGMREAGLSPKALSIGRRSMAKALGTYATKYTVPMIAAPMILRSVRKHRMDARRAAGLETSLDLKKQIKDMEQANG